MPTNNESNNTTTLYKDREVQRFVISFSDLILQNGKMNEWRV